MAILHSVQRGKTIAFLTRSIVDSSGLPLWHGVKQACKKHELNLFTFRGELFGKTPATVLYNLFDPARFDGYVSWMCSDNDSKVARFASRFSALPFVSLTSSIPGFPVITVDSKQGMFDLASHMIREHGCRKIAFVRGPEEHIYARERFEGYLQALKAHGIERDDTLITPPLSWNLTDGAVACDLFTEKRALKPGIDFQAVLCANDNLAIGFLDRSTQKGYSVPELFALAGYNASHEAQCTDPPLTTVSMPFDQQACSGIQTLVDLLSGKKVAASQVLYPDVVCSESCGCKSHKLIRAGTVSQSTQSDKKRKGPLRSLIQLHVQRVKTDSGTITSPQDDVLIQSMADSIDLVIHSRHALQSGAYMVSTSDITELLVCFLSDIRGSSTGTFLCNLGALLRKYARSGGDLEYWHEVISMLRDQKDSVCKNSNQSVQALDLFQQARIMIGEISFRAREARSLENAKHENILRQTGLKLSACHDIDSISSVLTEALDQLGLPCWFIALYDRDQAASSTEWIPQSARIILGKNDNGRIPLPPGGLEIRTGDIIPENLLPKTRVTSFEVESLHFQQRLLGYAIFEAFSDDGMMYQTLRDQLSNALYSVLLLTERADIRMRLEETVTHMGSKASLVAERSAQIALGVGEISGSMEKVAYRIQEISDHISSVLHSANEAGELVHRATGAIQDLSVSSTEIRDVAGMINGVAERTNVLALNAAIEAARAGQAGKGFSVVAKEVKSLAAQTMTSTSRIQEIVGRNRENTAQTEQTITQTRDAILRVTALSASITEAIKEQARSSSEISSLLIEASKGSEEISEAIAGISLLGNSLNQIQ